MTDEKHMERAVAAGDLLDVPLPVGLTPAEVAAEGQPGSVWVSKSYAEELLQRGLELRDQLDEANCTVSA